ncbi:hypothetical protein H5P36_23545 [Bacillus sp. APMAM]|nr:hypothetical protein [Bacillus sp. APMAM]
MDDKASTEYQYNIVLDILADMVKTYLTKNKEINKRNDKQEDDKRAS